MVFVHYTVDFLFDSRQQKCQGSCKERDKAPLSPYEDHEGMGIVFCPPPLFNDGSLCFEPDEKSLSDWRLVQSSYRVNNPRVARLVGTCMSGLDRHELSGSRR